MRIHSLAVDFETLPRQHVSDLHTKLFDSDALDYRNNFQENRTKSLIEDQGKKKITDQNTTCFPVKMVVSISSQSTEAGCSLTLRCLVKAFCTALRTGFVEM